MKIINQKHNFHYEIENIARMFFGDRVITSEASASAADDEFIRTSVDEEGGAIRYTAEINADGRVARLEDLGGIVSTSEQELMLSKLLYRLLSEFTGVGFPFGVLTGIRPVKLLARHIENGISAADAPEYFSLRYLSDKEAIKRCVRVYTNQKRILKQSALRNDKAIMLYIGIPFCPTKCAYCSFVSETAGDGSKLFSAYTDKLCDELAHIGSIIKKYGLTVGAIYIGGGTPTSLPLAQLSQLLSAVDDIALRSKFPPQDLEYTVEAGRPDSIDAEKLHLMKSFGVTRISINPQTFSDKVLRGIGRRHTAADVVSAFWLARQTGFGNINMDIIASLPGDTADGFKDTVEKVAQLSPDGITLHSFYRKRASRFGAERIETSGDGGIRMMDYAYDKLLRHGYEPYYLYKQKNSSYGECNIGFAKPGNECLYNICSMDESVTIIAAGAGGVTKLVGGSDDVRRIYNYKYANEYIGRFEDIIKRKRGIAEFYDAKIGGLP